MRDDIFGPRWFGKINKSLKANHKIVVDCIYFFNHVKCPITSFWKCIISGLSSQQQLIMKKENALIWNVTLFQNKLNNYSLKWTIKNNWNIVMNHFCSNTKFKKKGGGGVGNLQCRVSVVTVASFKMLKNLIWEIKIPNKNNHQQ